MNLMLKHKYLILRRVLQIGVLACFAFGASLFVQGNLSSSQAGFIGGAIATLGVVLPSFVIIFLIASIMKDLLKYSGVKAMLSGIRPCVVAMILATGVTMALSSLLNITTINSKPAFEYKALIIFLLIALADVLLLKLKKFKLSPIAIIVGSAFLGVIFY